MIQTNTKIDLDGKRMKINEFILKENRPRQSLRRSVLIYFSQTGLQDQFLMLLSFPFCFSIHFFSGVPHVIYPLLIDLGPPFVDHLGYYLSVCPIGYPLQPSVSRNSLGSTVQGSSPHKCGQKVSCRAFNVVAAAFPQTPLSLHPFCTSTVHVPISRASWKAALIDRVCL